MNKKGGVTLETQTIGQWLEGLVGGNTSTEQDDIKMTNLLHRVGFGGAVCTCGIVYLEGRGTLEAPPTSIQSIAKMLVDKASQPIKG